MQTYTQVNLQPIIIDLEPVYDIAPPPGGIFKGMIFLTHMQWAFTGKSLQSSVGALMSYGTLKYRPFPIFRPKPLTLSQYMTQLAPTGNFQGYIFLTYLAVGIYWLKFATFCWGVNELWDFEISPILIFRPKTMSGVYYAHFTAQIYMKLCLKRL